MWKGGLEDLKGLKKDLRCIKYEVKKRPPESPAVQERDVTLEPSETADLRVRLLPLGTAAGDTAAVQH
jgi:hypothetical protein